MQCYFITGAPGTGKSTHAKELADKFGYKTFISSGSNDILDGYAGEECIILDDLRASCMALSDLLKMLDNNTASTVKSRYKNKVLECRLIIITTVNNIDDFYSNVFKESPEPIQQFKRRCSLHIRMTEQFIYCKMYSPSIKDYGKEYQYPNAVLESFRMADKSPEEVKESIAKMLGLTESTILEMVKDCHNSIRNEQTSFGDELSADNPWDIKKK